MHHSLGECLETSSHLYSCKRYLLVRWYGEEQDYQIQKFKTPSSLKLLNLAIMFVTC